MAIQEQAGRGGSGTTCATLTPEEQAKIREQVERIAGSSRFEHSRRYPAFLRYVVEQTLLGASHDLKERTLGVAVFKRPADYDTSADPVVRNTASEVRKRLEEYYSEREHAGELRILLPVGAYVPEFPAAGDARAATAAEAAGPAENLNAPAALEARRALVSRRALAYGGLGLAVVAALVIAVTLARPKAGIDRFWLPVLEDRESLLIVTETLITTPSPLTDPAGASASAPRVTEIDPNLVLSVSEGAAKLGAFLTAHGKAQHMELARNVSLTRLRRGPAVLLGAFNNPWTMRVVEPLRFRFEMERDTLVRRVVDRQNPTRRDWAAPMQPGLREDYAIVARARGVDTGQVAVVIAGLGERGTAAAVEVLTNPKAFERVASQLPSGWSRRNLELVIRTRFVNEEWGDPQVVAVHVWD